MKRWLTWSRVKVVALAFNGVWFAVIYHSYVSRRPKYRECDPPAESHRLRIFNSIAENYDSIYQPIEKKLGIEKKRIEHFRQARGHVLELGSGTGLNLNCYKNIHSLTCVDKSIQMCAELAKNVKRLKPDFPVIIIHGDAADLPFDNCSFDTVVTTHTLCSVENPNNTISEINRILKKKGRYLAIERGRIYYGATRRIMEFLDLYPNPVIPWENGYYEDRDPRELISNMDIKVMKTFNYGVHYVITAAKSSPRGGDELIGTESGPGIPRPNERANIIYKYS